MRTAVVAAVVIVVVGIAGLTAGGLGLTSAWPVLLGVVLALAATSASSGRSPAAMLAIRGGCAVLGAALGWVAYAIRVGVLPPDLATTQALVLVGALIIIGGVSALLGPDAFWAGALGLAAFSGVFEPILAADPAGFLSTSPPALVATVLGLAVGLGGGLLGRAAGELLGADGRATARPVTDTTAEVRP